MLRLHLKLRSEFLLAALVAALANSSCHAVIPPPKSTIHMAEPAAAHQLLSGFYEVAQNRWRWTGPSFSVALGPPPLPSTPTSHSEAATLHVQLYFPPDEINQLGPITITAATAGFDLGETTYFKAGAHEFVADVPPAALCTNVLPIMFSLDKYLAPSSADARALGTVVTSIALQSSR